MNPCRCGHLGEPELACTRAPRCGEDYRAKLSGPLLDRIDLFVAVPPVTASDLSLPPAAEGTAEVATRVAAARAIQSERFAGVESDVPIRSNAAADGRLLERVAAPDAAGRALLTEAAERLHLSARGYHRVLKVARTLADLDAADTVQRRHVAEALSYRMLGRVG